MIYTIPHSLYDMEDVSYQIHDGVIGIYEIVPLLSSFVYIKGVWYNE